MKTFTMTFDDLEKNAVIIHNGDLWVDIGTRGDCDSSVDFSIKDGFYCLSKITLRAERGGVINLTPSDPEFSNYEVKTPFGTTNRFPADAIKSFKPYRERLEMDSGD